jgi:hypothetical protein
VSIGKRCVSKRVLLILAPVLLLLVAGVAYAAGELPFTDIDGHWAEDAIVRNAERGVIAGHEDGTFGPEEFVTRAQLATLLDRFNGKITCTECHNDTTLIWSKEAQFRERSVHGTGEAFEEGEGANCAGCHGTEGAKARIAAGLPPHDPSVEGVVNVSPYDCRTCHNIHTTYTRDDFSLVGGAQSVDLEFSDGTFDKGMGNLCANCHQIRNARPVASGGNVEITSTRFGTHYGAEANMMLGEGGMLVDGNPSVHYQTVADSCVGCHMGDERNHTYEPTVERCQPCHADLEDFDRNGVQTEIQGMLDQVKAALIANGIMNAEERSVAGTYPEAVAAAMWNYKFVTYDQSRGIHNPPYARALLQQAIDTLQ